MRPSDRRKNRLVVHKENNAVFYVWTAPNLQTQVQWTVSACPVQIGKRVIGLSVQVKTICHPLPKIGFGPVFYICCGNIHIGDLRRSQTERLFRENGLGGDLRLVEVEGERIVLHGRAT